MAGVDVRVSVADIAADQWGLLTTAQAVAAGVTRMMLSRMVERGELERVMQGVYATPAATGGELTQRRAAWLSLDPATPAHVRLEKPEDSGVLSHASAAAMHNIGDILEPQTEVTLPTRYRARRDELRTHRAVLEPHEVILVDGLPVTTPARTVADLLLAGHDQDHVATVVADALRRDLTNVQGLQDALEGIESSRSGEEVLASLMATAGIDPDSLARSIIGSEVGAAATQLAAVRLVSEALAKGAEPFRVPLATTKAYDDLMKSLTASMGGDVQKRLQEAMRPYQTGSWARAVSSVHTVPMPKLSPELYLQLTRSLDTTKAWRALQLAQQTADAARRAHSDDDDDEDGEADS